MKRNLLLTVSVLALTCGSAMAADLGRGGLKDGADYDAGGSPAIWTGWTVTGSVGIANQEYENRRSITGEGGFFKNDKKGADRITEDGSYCHKNGNDADDFSGDVAPIGYHCPDGFYKKTVNDEAEIAHFGADDTANDVRYETPLAAIDFLRRETFDTSGLQGGLEVGRRIQSGNFVFEVALGGNLDAGDGDRSSFDTVHAVTVDPKGSFGGPYPIDTDDFALTGHATQEVSKNYDLYAVLRAGAALGSDQRLLISGGVGIVSGSFNLKGSHVFDGDTDGLFTTRYDEDDNAIGLLVELSAKYKLAKNWDAGVIGTYKDLGTVSAGSSASQDFAFNEEGTKGVYARVNDRHSADVDEWAIKGTLTYTFDE